MTKLTWILRQPEWMLFGWAALCLAPSFIDMHRYGHVDAGAFLTGAILITVCVGMSAENPK